MSVHKDATIADVKQMLTEVADPHGQQMELYCQYAPSEKHSRLNDKSQLQVCGFKPENASPDRPGVLVLTFKDGMMITKFVFKKRFLENPTSVINTV